MDKMSRQTRSALMGRIRAKNTKPELVVRRLIHSWGYRFRLHRSDLPGSPDLAFIGQRKVIFVHGCFWHAHRDCKDSVFPKTRRDFWRTKLLGNRQRDKKSLKRLKQLGWESLVVWECELSNILAVEAHLREFLVK